MTPARAPMGADVLQTQIDGLAESMKGGFAEMKAMLTDLSERVRALENSEAGCRPMTTGRLEAAWRKIDELAMVATANAAAVSDLGHANRVLKAKVDEIELTVKGQAVLLTELVSTNRLLKWIAGILTAVLIAVLLSLVTGQAAIVFH
jgi:hypothetical protein